MIVSKLKEALICFKAGRVTLPYPFAPREPADGFHGRVVVDAEKCVGCGGCAEVCPPRCIEVSDPNPEKRVLDFLLERCTYCARCAEVPGGCDHGNKGVRDSHERPAGYAHACGGVHEHLPPVRPVL